MRVAVVIALVIMACGGTAQPTAVGAPDDGGLPADSPTLGLQTLGTNPTISFYGVQGTETLTIPVPPGLLPAELTAIVEIPVNLRAGTLAVTQDDRTSPEYRCPMRTECQLSFRSRGLPSSNNAVTLVLRSYLVPLDGYCLDPTNPLRLTDAAIRYDGVETPPDSGSGLPAAGIAQADDVHPGATIDQRSPTRRSGWPPRWWRTTASRTPRSLLTPLADGQAGPPLDRRHRWNARSSSARVPRHGACHCAAPAACRHC